jgi:hypothetical protein
MAEKETPAEGQKGEKRRNNNSAPHQSQRFGNVFAKIFANQGPMNQVVFKAEFVRLYSSPSGVGETHTFETADIRDLMAAAHWAKKSIAKLTKSVQRGFIAVSFTK